MSDSTHFDPDSVGRAFDAAVEGLAPLAGRARVVLGCSAGGDSMALLDLAARAAESRHWQVAVAHLDHAQRPESAEEAGFVAEQARRRGLHLFTERLEPSDAPLNEDAMRQARHALFGRVARVWHAAAVCLAHQADDRAETLLIRLLAGSGPTGLGSIRPLETLGELTVVRPLLGLRRAELRGYLRARGLKWREDPTNDGAAGKRTWVRNELLPSIRERIGLDPTERIVRAAELIDQEAGALNESARMLLEYVSSAPPPGAAGRLDLDHPVWRDASANLRRQLVRQWLWALRRGPHPPGHAAVQEACDFIERAARGTELRTIDRIHIVRGPTWLVAFAPEIGAETRKRILNG